MSNSTDSTPRPDDGEGCEHEWVAYYGDRRFFKCRICHQQMTAQEWWDLTTPERLLTAIEWHDEDE